MLKKEADLGVTDGLGVVPLAKVLPPRMAIGKTTGEGTQEQEEDIEITEDIPTQPPSTKATHAPSTNAPAPPPASIPAGQSGVQGFRSTTEGVKVRNIESDLDRRKKILSNNGRWKVRKKGMRQRTY